MSLLQKYGLLVSLLFTRLSSSCCLGTDTTSFPLDFQRNHLRDHARVAKADESPTSSKNHPEWYLPNVKAQIKKTWLFASGDLSEISTNATQSTDSTVPTPVDVPALLAGEYVIAASAGGLHSALLTNEGRILTAGSSPAGEDRGLGRGTRNGTELGFHWVTEFYPLDANEGHAAVPTRSPRVVQVVASQYYTLALDETGNVWSTGSNAYGQLCLNDTEARDRFHQVRMPSDTNIFDPENRIVDVVLGERHTLFLTEDGKAYGCGWNQYGQLGIGLKGQHVLSPVEIVIDEPDETNFNITADTMNDTIVSERTINHEVIAEVAAGRGSSYFLTSSGHVYSMGTNYNGQLCLGHRQDRSLPTMLDGVERFLFSGRDFSYHDEGVGVASIAAGQSSLYLLLSNGLPLACGDNTHGQLGLGADAADVVAVPTPMANVSATTAVFAGPIALGVHLVSNSRVYAVGFDGAGARENWHVPQLMTCADEQTAVDEGVIVSSGNDHVLYLATAVTTFECEEGSTPTPSAAPTASRMPSCSLSPSNIPSQSSMPSSLPTTSVPTSSWSPSSFLVEDTTNVPTLLDIVSSAPTLSPVTSEDSYEAGQSDSPPGPPRVVVPETDNRANENLLPGFYLIGLSLIIMFWL